MVSIFILCSVLAQLCSKVLPINGQFNPTEHVNWKLIQDRHCRSASSTSRIIGGVEAGLGDFPWIVGLHHKTEDGKRSRYACSGTILTKNTILTAAHCVTHAEPGEKIFDVMVGDWDRTTPFDCSNGVCSPEQQSIIPYQIIIHSRYPEYEKESKDYDIALIRLGKDIVFNSYAFPICMLDNDHMGKSFVNSDATVAGWGIGASDYKPEKMQKVKLQVKENSVCVNDALLNYVVSENQMCLAGSDATAGTCSGDGGGPIMFVNQSFTPPRTYLIGIVSFRRAACATPVPTIGTRVSSFMEWILDNLVSNSKDFLLIDPSKPFSQINNYTEI